MSLRERTFAELFQTLMGVEKKSCEYYPCHFDGQDCSFCFCPFYPCLIYETGGELKNEKIWSCMNCEFVHKKEIAEEIKNILSSYSFQTLVDEDWFFYSEIIQELIFGEIRGRWVGNVYTFYEINENEKCYLVKIEDFEIKKVIKGVCSELSKKDGVLIPLS